MSEDSKPQGLIIGDKYYTVTDWHYNASGEYSIDRHASARGEKSGWKNNQDQAQAMGGDLAVFESKEEEAQVLDALDENDDVQKTFINCNIDLN